MVIGPHPSHKTRMSDASSFDEICVNCGAHDEIGGWGELAKPCTNPPKQETEGTAPAENNEAKA